MGLILGLGNAIPMGNKSRGWSSYWLTHYPTNFTAIVASNTQIDLSWLDNSSGEDGFVIERSTDGINFTEIEAVAPNTTSYSDTGLTAGTTYYYRIRGFKGISYSDYSAIIHTVTYEPELETYITGLTTPLSDPQKTAVDTFMKALKSGLGIANLSDAFDVMLLFAGETQESSLRNLVENDHHATPANSPTWTQFEGFAGDGNTKVVNVDFLPLTDHVNYTQNAASVGHYSRSDINESKFDSQWGGNGYVCLRYTNLYLSRINQASDDSPTIANTNSQGLFISVRTANNAVTHYRNNTPLGSGARTSTAMNDTALVTCKGTKQIAFLFMGKLFDSDDRLVIQNAIEAYMDGNGKGVIA